LRIPLKLRFAASALFGLVMWTATVWRFLPYSERMHDPGPNLWMIFAAEFLGGLLLTAGLSKNRWTICHTLIAAMFAANTVLIQVDWKADPTNHNLAPFEYIIIAIFALPVYLGAGAAWALDRWIADRAITR
jgi:uncharacterized membrane protein YphA (DoxX/SURF4 family)